MILALGVQVISHLFAQLSVVTVSSGQRVKDWLWTRRSPRQESHDIGVHLFLLLLYFSLCPSHFPLRTLPNSEWTGKRRKSSLSFSDPLPGSEETKINYSVGLTPKDLVAWNRKHKTMGQLHEERGAQMRGIAWTKVQEQGSSVTGHACKPLGWTSLLLNHLWRFDILPSPISPFPLT